MATGWLIPLHFLQLSITSFGWRQNHQCSHPVGTRSATSHTKKERQKTWVARDLSSSSAPPVSGVSRKWVVLIVLETSGDQGPYNLISRNSPFDKSLLGRPVGNLVKCLQEPQPAPTDSGAFHLPLTHSGAKAGGKNPIPNTVSTASGQLREGTPHPCARRPKHTSSLWSVLVTVAVFTQCQTNS